MLFASLAGAAADTAFQRQSELGDGHFAAGRYAESLASYRRALADPATGLKRDPSSDTESYVVPEGWHGSPQVGRTLARLAASHMALVESASSAEQRGIHLYTALDVAISSLLALEYLRESADVSQRLAIADLEQLSTDVVLEAGYMLDRLRPEANLSRTLFFASDRARSRLLLDVMGAGRGIESAAPPAKTWDISARIAVLELTLRREAVRPVADPAALARMAAAISALRQELTRLPAPPRPTWQQRSGSSELIQSKLRIHETLVSYYVGERHLYIFVLLEQGALQLVEVPVTRAALQGLVTRYLDKMQTESLSWILESRELFDLLLGPIRRFLAPCLREQAPRPTSPPCRLLVVPHGAINLVPFGSLVDPQTQRALVDDFSVALMPMANYAVLSTFRAQAQPSKEQLLIGIAKFDGRPELRHTEAEVTALSKIIGATAEVQTQSAALQPMERLLQTIGQYRLVHIATHGVHDAGNPLMSYLVLKDAAGRDAKLFAFDLLQRPMAAGLVVLSACETGLSVQTQIPAGADLLGFPWAMLAAGADRVVVSLWQVRDDSTRNLMISFYAGLNAPFAQAADALRQAQLAQRRATPHPRNWAGFGLMGSP